MFYPEFCGFVGTQMQLAKHLDDVHGSLLCSSRSTHLKTLGYHCSMCGEWKRYKIAVHNHGCIKATPIPHNTLVSYGRGKGKGLTNSKKLLLKQDFTQLLFDNFILWMTNGAVEADLQAVLKTLCDLSASVPLLCGENAFQYIANGINASNSGKTNRRDARSFLKIWNKTMTNIATQNPPETLPHVASSSRGEFQSMEADEQTAKENGSTSEQSGTLEQQQIMLKISMQLAQLSETMHRLENKQRLVEVLAKKALAREMPKARNGRNVESVRPPRRNYERQKHFLGHLSLLPVDQQNNNRKDQRQEGPPLNSLVNKQGKKKARYHLRHRPTREFMN